MNFVLLCLLYLKVISARPWGHKEAFGDLKSPKTPLLTASFLRPNDSGHTVHCFSPEKFKLFKQTFPDFRFAENSRQP